MDQNMAKIRSYIKNRTRLSIGPKLIYELCRIYGSNAVSAPTVLRRVKAFDIGESCGTHSGRPNTSITETSIEAVTGVVGEDSRFSLKEIASTCSKNISEGSVIEKNVLGGYPICSPRINNCNV